MSPFKRRRTRRAVARQARRLFGEQLEDRRLLSATPHPLKETVLNANFPPVDVNGTAFFEGNDGVNPTTLWKSDGSDAGTVQASSNVFPLLGRTAQNGLYPAASINGTL